MLYALQIFFGHTILPLMPGKAHVFKTSIQFVNRSSIYEQSTEIEISD
jgi:hypothetical protein